MPKKCSTIVTKRKPKESKQQPFLPSPSHLLSKRRKRTNSSSSSSNSRKPQKSILSPRKRQPLSPSKKDAYKKIKEAYDNLIVSNSPRKNQTV